MSKNPYRLRKVERKDVLKNVQPIKAKPNLEVGDTVSCVRLKPLFFTINEPIVVRTLEAHSRYASGWKVSVDTSDGLKEFDSDYFMRLTT